MQPPPLSTSHRDYRVFVDRTGNQPPLHAVEANVLEIARRIHHIETIKSVDVQRVFRGTISRMFFKELIQVQHGGGERGIVSNE